MKSIRRALTFATVIGGLILFGCARPAPHPDATREPLGNFDPETQSLIARAERIVFFIPFSHWDTDWHDSFDAYSKQADQNILKAIEIAKQEPRYRYALEQVLFVQHFWETHPDSRADLERLVQNRQLSFAWSGITQPETSLVAPSIQVRNLKLGEAWIARTFGAEYVPRTAWQSDAFGNSAVFPSYLSQLNIPYLFIGRHQGRCDPDYEDCTPLPPAFYWTSPASPQGRVLVAYMSYYTASGDLYRDNDPNVQIGRLRQTIEENFKNTDSKFLLLPVGFDFLDPRPSLLEFVDRWNSDNDNKDAVLVISDSDSAFQYLATQQLPEITVDMNPIWQAFYNTRPFAKIADKESEYYLTAADKFGLLIDAPTSTAWDLAAFNAHYDNIAGVGFDWVWEKTQRPRYEQTLAVAKDDLATTLADISARVPASVMIFNPTSWARSEVIEISDQLTDINLLPTPIQQTDSNTVAFLAQDIPSLGYLGLNGGQASIKNPASMTRNGNQITLSNGLVSVSLDGDHGGAFSSLRLSTGDKELLDGFGDDVTYWTDTGDVYGASFGDVIARESEVTAELTALASGPLIARAQAVFALGGQHVFKTVTVRADDPLIEVQLEIQALPDSVAIAHTSTILDTDMRTDDLGFGAFNHKIDTRPIAPGDRTYRREIFYPIMYWSDVSSNDLGLTLITHGLQGVSGGAARGVMLVRQASGDYESVSDPGVHHLRYAYLPHAGTAEDAKPRLAAYEFNQPLIIAWKSGQMVNVQIPFDEDIKKRELEDLENSSQLPLAFSLLSARDAIVADLYREGEQVMAVVLDYDPMNGGGIRVGEDEIVLPQSVFTLMPLSLKISSP